MHGIVHAKLVLATDVDRPAEDDATIFPPQAISDTLFTAFEQQFLRVHLYVKLADFFENHILLHSLIL